MEEEFEIDLNALLHHSEVQLIPTTVSVLRALSLQVEEEFEIDLNDAEPDFLKGQTAKTGGEPSDLPAAAGFRPIIVPASDSCPSWGPIMMPASVF